MSNSDKPVKLNATLFWVYNHEKNDRSDKYQFDACRLTPKAVEALEAMGLKVKVADKEGDQRGNYITIKSENQFRFFDEGGDRVPTEARISNGSKAVLLVGFYDWTFKKDKGRSPSLKSLSFTELELYEGGAPVDAEGAL